MPEENQPSDNQPSDNKPPVEEPPKPKSFSQEELNRIANESKKQGRDAATSALMKDLGIEDVESAKELLAEANRRKEAEKSEAQREKEAAERERREAANERAAAKAERQSIEIEKQLVRAGVPAERLDWVTRMVSVGADDSPEDISAEVENLKKEMPELFVSKAGAPDSHVTGRSPSGTRSSADAMAAGAERAKNWKPKAFGNFG